MVPKCPHFSEFIYTFVFKLVTSCALWGGSSDTRSFVLMAQEESTMVVAFVVYQGNAASDSPSTLFTSYWFWRVVLKMLKNHFQWFLLYLNSVQRYTSNNLERKMLSKDINATPVWSKAECIGTVCKKHFKISYPCPSQRIGGEHWGWLWKGGG